MAQCRVPTMPIQPRRRAIKRRRPEGKELEWGRRRKYAKLLQQLQAIPRELQLAQKRRAMTYPGSLPFVPVNAPVACPRRDPAPPTRNPVPPTRNPGGGPRLPLVSRRPTARRHKPAPTAVEKDSVPCSVLRPHPGFAADPAPPQPYNPRPAPRAPPSGRTRQQTSWPGNGEELPIFSTGVPSMPPPPRRPQPALRRPQHHPRPTALLLRPQPKLQPATMHPRSAAGRSPLRTLVDDALVLVARGVKHIIVSHRNGVNRRSRPVVLALMTVPIKRMYHLPPSDAVELFTRLTRRGEKVGLLAAPVPKKPAAT